MDANKAAVGSSFVQTRRNHFHGGSPACCFIAERYFGILLVKVWRVDDEAGRVLVSLFVVERGFGIILYQPDDDGEAEEGGGSPERCS